MKREVYIIGGIKGLQAYSTQVVTNAIQQGLVKAGWQVHTRILHPGWIPAHTLLRWLMETIYRHLFYPLWCRYQIPRGALVYVTDHANAGTILTLRAPRRTVVHVHDLTSLRPLSEFPYPIRWRNRLIWGLSYLTKRPGILKTDHIIAISQFTADELHRYLAVHPTRITVAHNGLDHTTYWPLATEKARRKIGLPENAFILMTVGPASYRKNNISIARALQKIAHRIPHLLWLHVGQLEQHCLEQVNNTPVTVKQFSEVNNNTMRHLYASASIFVTASLYEGFGLPPVEALACGTPVIASSIPAHREVLQNNAHFFSPEAVDELAEELLASANRTLPRLATNIAQQYSWDKTVTIISNTLSAGSSQATDAPSISA